MLSAPMGANFVRTSYELRTNFVRSAYAIRRMSDIVPSDPLGPPGFQLRAHFVRTSYELRTKCARSAHTPHIHGPLLHTSCPLCRPTSPSTATRLRRRWPAARHSQLRWLPPLGRLPAPLRPLRPPLRLPQCLGPVGPLPLSLCPPPLQPRSWGHLRGRWGRT